MSPSYSLLNYPTPVPTPGRGQPVSTGRSRPARTFHAARAGSSLLLAGLVAALLVVANQVVESWTDGNLLIAWIVLWGLAFAALALLAAPSRQAAASLRAAFRAWNERRIQAAHDEQYWQAAQSDPRIMADIRRAVGEPDLHDSRASRYYMPWPIVLYRAGF